MTWIALYLTIAAIHFCVLHKSSPRRERDSQFYKNLTFALSWPVFMSICTTAHVKRARG